MSSANFLPPESVSALVNRGYDHRGRQASFTLTVGGETVGTTTYAYDLMDRVTAVTADGVAYFYGLNRTHNSEGEIYVYNAHGDVVQLVCDNSVVASYTYDAFGNLTSQIGESDNPFLYCGEYFDAETQTYYLRARYYNPANGRFTQQDAWAFMDASDPLSLNLYTYCCNNPVMYVDPSGCFLTELRELQKVRPLYGLQLAIYSYVASNEATKLANKYADDQGWYTTGRCITARGHAKAIRVKHYITWDNAADALRHMAWCAKMAQKESVEYSKFVSDNHELQALYDLNWVESESDGIVYAKMNQPTLMDLWNNYTGRVLSEKTGLQGMELFEYAIENGYLITDATEVYSKLGVENYITDSNAWTVYVKWDMNADTITFIKEGMVNEKREIGKF